MGRICCYQIYEIASDKKWVAWKDRYKVLVSSSQICRYKSNTSIIPVMDLPRKSIAENAPSCPRRHFEFLTEMKSQK